jgi:uncharacterized damage-inducible protein DinB
MESITALLIKELLAEAEITRKMLSRIPNEKFGWRPHEKSMTIKSLATHIAELPAWITMAIKTDGLDFEENPYAPQDIDDTNNLLVHFEESLASGIQSLKEVNIETLDKDWILKSGKTILSKSSKYETIRMSFAQIIHHRAQMGVYLRLLNIPIPGSYGPSADEE